MLKKTALFLKDGFNKTHSCVPPPPPPPCFYLYHIVLILIFLCPVPPRLPLLLHTCIVSYSYFPSLPPRFYSYDTLPLPLLSSTIDAHHTGHTGHLGPPPTQKGVSSWSWHPAHKPCHPCHPDYRIPDSAKIFEEKRDRPEICGVRAIFFVIQFFGEKDVWRIQLHANCTHTASFKDIPARNDLLLG